MRRIVFGSLAMAAWLWLAAPSLPAQDLAAPPGVSSSAPSSAPSAPAMLAETLTQLEPADPADPTHSEIAFRFSDEFFRTLLRRSVTRTTPVRQCVLGAWVTGTAHTQAKVDLLFQPNESEAQFYILLTGQTVSNTVGASGPARVYTTATTRFRAWKLVRFTEGRFDTSPAGIRSTTTTQVSCIGSTARTRLVDRLVRRVATNRVAETRGYTTWFADQQARRRVLESFNESVDDAIDDANEQLSVRQTLISRFGGLENLRYRLLTTARYLEVLVNIASAAEPRRPPAANGRALSPLEIWVRTHINDEMLPPILQEWAPRYKFFIERGFERLAEAATPEEIEFKLQFTTDLDWVVMRFGDELLERLQRRVQQRRERASAPAQP